MTDWTGELAELRFHWGAAYEIGYQLGQYRAVRRDDQSVVRADYAVRPVPRCLPPPGPTGPGRAPALRPE